MLNYFRGGDLDGKAYALSTLLDHQYLMDGYRWTSEVIISKVTGASARVWRHETLDDAEKAIAEIDRKLDLEVQKQEVRNGPTIAERRDRLGISRSRLAELAGHGMTHAKIMRIEQDGVRTTDEERAIVNGALDQIENQVEASR
jgi:hypothetical protein